MLTLPTKKALRITAATLMLSALLASCGDKAPNYDYTIDMDLYQAAISTSDQAYLMLTNKQFPLKTDYTPESLSAIPSSLTLYGKEIQMESTAALAAEAMVRELRSCGYEDIAITSGYRSYAYQQILFNTYLGNEMADHPDWTQAQCEAYVLTYSARPGESEHQTGLCMDLTSTNHVVLDESFAKNPAYEWLSANAHAFGFILRYPSDKSDVTGYSYEPWHYRFVGVKAATAIHEKGITLEEYLD
jgi:LAS superfamily LD-carboxypeptidase LdcB